MDKEKAVYVIGAGGHAKVVISTLQAAGHTVKAVLDDDSEKWGNTILGIPIVGSSSEIMGSTDVLALSAIGDNSARKRLTERLHGIEWLTVVHPRAYVHPTARLGSGTVVLAGSIIQPDTHIGAHAIINTGATVDHDCSVGDFVHVAPGCHVAGGVRLNEGVFLGIGAAVVPGVVVGKWTVVGAGGVVVHSLPDGIVAVGVPAKPMRS